MNYARRSMNYTEWWRAVSETGRCATVSHMTYFSKSFNAGEMQPQWETNETVSTEKQAHCLLTCVNEVVWTSGDMNVKAGSLTWKTWSRAITSAIVFLLFLNDSTTLITFKTWTNGKKGPWSHWPLHLQQHRIIYFCWDHSHFNTCCMDLYWALGFFS